MDDLPHGVPGTPVPPVQPQPTVMPQTFVTPASPVQPVPPAVAQPPVTPVSPVETQPAYPLPVVPQQPVQPVQVAAQNPAPEPQSSPSLSREAGQAEEFPIGWTMVIIVTVPVIVLFLLYKLVVAVFLPRPNMINTPGVPAMAGPITSQTMRKSLFQEFVDTTILKITPTPMPGMPPPFQTPSVNKPTVFQQIQSFFLDIWANVVGRIFPPPPESTEPMPVETVVPIISVPTIPPPENPVETPQ